MKRVLLPIILVAAVVAVAARPVPPVTKTVRDYGAVGDGRADDTAAIQAAIDADGSVRFPKGTYRLTRTLVIDLDKTGYASLTADGTATLRMDAAGPAIKIVGTHAGTAAPASVQPNVWEKQRTPRIDGLEITGTHPDADAIEATGTMQLTVLGTTIRKCRHGVRLTGRNRNVLISACHIYENRGVGVYLDHVNLHQTNVIGCHISYCDGGGVVCRGGEVRNVHIGTCDIESNMAKAGPPGANVLIDCTAGSTAEVAITGCTIQHANVPGSANVRILGFGAGIKKGTTGNWGHVTIGDNVFSDVAVNVDLVKCRGVTLTGNTFWMGYESNLRAADCEQLVVGPNAFERNPAYDYGTSTTTVNAISFTNCRDCTLTGLHVHNTKGPAAVTLTDCRRFNVTGCSILDCDGIGLKLVNLRHSRVSDCLIRDDRPGTTSKPMVVEGGEGNRIE